MKLFLILGNQLFDPKYLKNYKDHSFFMCEDYGLCTYERHHKLSLSYASLNLYVTIDAQKKVTLCGIFKV